VLCQHHDAQFLAVDSTKAKVLVGLDNGNGWVVHNFFHEVGLLFGDVADLFCDCLVEFNLVTQQRSDIAEEVFDGVIVA